MPVETERSKFLVDLLAEVDSFDAVYQSHDPVEKGEIAQGVLTPWEQRTYSLARYYSKQLRHLAIERDYQDTSTTAKDPEIAEMKYKVDLLMEMTWYCVRAERNLWSEANVGVRENFTVITSDDSGDDDDGFKKFLKVMFRT
jgi:hypothetical protein